MNLDEMVAALREDIAGLQERKEAGEDVEEELGKKSAELAQAEETDEPEVSELTRLRREKREAEEKAIAERAAMAAIKAVEQEETERAERIRQHTLEVVKSYISDGGADEAVRHAMKSVRSGSRYVGPNADESFVEHVASGGEFATKNHPTPRGMTGGVKALHESKSLVKFFGAVSRFAKNQASDAEYEWIKGLQTKALAEGTGSSGGFLVPQEWMPDILGLLRAEAIVRRAGPRIVPFNKQMNQTSVSSGATAYYTAENAAITPSEQTFAEAALLTPKNLTGLVPVSNYLLGDAPQAEEFVRNDLIEVMALREDLAFLRGTGGGGEPRGFLNMVGITSDPISLGGAPNGFQITLGQTRRIKATYRGLNARAVKLCWFFNAAFITYLETLVDTQGRFLADANILQVNEDQASGVFDGVPFYSTNQLPANLTQGSSTNATDLYLVNMAEAIVGENQDLEIAVSDQAAYTPDGGTTWISAFQNNQTLFRSVLRHDIAHRRPNQVIVQHGVLV